LEAEILSEGESEKARHKKA
jgi:hypothetical protein